MLAFQPFASGQLTILSSRLDPLDPPGAAATIPLVGRDGIDASGAFAILGRDTVLGSLLSGAPGYYYSYAERLGQTPADGWEAIYVDIIYYLRSTYQFREGKREVLIGAGIRLKMVAEVHWKVSLHSWEEVEKGIRKGRVRGTLTMEAVGLENPELDKQLPGPQALNKKSLEAALRLAGELTPFFAVLPASKLPAAVLASRYHPDGQQQQKALPAILLPLNGQQIQQQKSH